MARKEKDEKSVTEEKNNSEANDSVSDNIGETFDDMEDFEKEETLTNDEANDSGKESEAKEEELSPEDLVLEWKNKYLRLSAEFDNYRKRTLKEKIELSKSAGEDIFLSILPIVDDFERALQSMNDASDVDAVKEGISLIYNKFGEFLKQRGIKPIEAVNERFDTDLHEAVTKIPAPSKKLKGKVVDEIEKGYFLNDKVLRFSKVVIGE